MSKVPAPVFAAQAKRRPSSAAARPAGLKKNATQPSLAKENTSKAGNLLSKTSPGGQLGGAKPAAVQQQAAVPEKGGKQRPASAAAGGRGAKLLKSESSPNLVKGKQNPKAGLQPSRGIGDIRGSDRDAAIAGDQTQKTLLKDGATGGGMKEQKTDDDACEAVATPEQASVSCADDEPGPAVHSRFGLDAGNIDGARSIGLLGAAAGIALGGKKYFDEQLEQAVDDVSKLGWMDLLAPASYLRIPLSADLRAEQTQDLVQKVLKDSKGALGKDSVTVCEDPPSLKINIPHEAASIRGVQLLLSQKATVVYPLQRLRNGILLQPGLARYAESLRDEVLEEIISSVERSAALYAEAIQAIMEDPKERQAYAGLMEERSLSMYGGELRKVGDPSNMPPDVFQQDAETLNVLKIDAEAAQALLKLELGSPSVPWCVTEYNSDDVLEDDPCRYWTPPCAEFAPFLYALHFDPGTKQRQRLLQDFEMKAALGRNPVKGIMDASQIRVIFESFFDLKQAVNDIKERFGSDLMWLENRFRSPTCIGFPDVVVGLRTRVSPDGKVPIYHISEVQLMQKRVHEMQQGEARTHYEAIAKTLFKAGVRAEHCEQMREFVLNSFEATQGRICRETVEDLVWVRKLVSELAEQDSSIPFGMGKQLFMAIATRAKQNGVRTRTIMKSVEAAPQNLSRDFRKAMKAEEKAQTQRRDGHQFPHIGPPQLSENELLLQLGTCPPKAGETGIKGIWIDPANYFDLHFTDQVKEDAQVPFSGSKLKAYTYIKRTDVIKQLDLLESESNFYVQQIDFHKYPLEDILLMYDPEKNYDESIVWCTTQAAFEREVKRIQSLRQDIVDEYTKWWESGGRGRWRAPLSETEMMTILGPCPPQAGDAAIKGIVIEPRNYVTMRLVDQAKESDKVPFSGMKLKPYTYLKKSDILRNVKRLDYESDFFENTKDFEKYPLEDVLFMYDPHRQYGEKIIFCSTRDSFEREVARIQGLKKAITDSYKQWWKDGAKGRWSMSRV